LARPIHTLQQAADEKPILPALWLTIFQGLSLALGTRYAHENGGFVLSWLIKNLPSWNLVVFYAFIFPPALWFIKAAVLNLVAELLGGPPRGLSLLATTGIACSPLLLVLPAALIAVALAEPDLNTGFVSHLWFVFAIGVHALVGVVDRFCNPGDLSLHNRSSLFNRVAAFNCGDAFGLHHLPCA
jgi:hypothetical protein